MDIEVVFLREAEEFLDGLDFKAVQKIFSDVRKTKAGLRGEWFRKMPGTDEIWEFRTFYNKQYLRLFAFWHHTPQQPALIVCTHGIIKKTDRTSDREIERATQLKRRYLVQHKTG